MQANESILKIFMPEDKRTLTRRLKVGAQRAQPPCLLCARAVEHLHLGDDLEVVQTSELFAPPRPRCHLAPLTFVRTVSGCQLLSIGRLELG